MEPMPPQHDEDMPWADALERPCIYMAHPGETLESIGHKFMIALTRLLYYNLRYGRQEPLPDGARIILPEPEIQPLNPRRQVMPKRR